MNIVLFQTNQILTMKTVKNALLIVGLVICALSVNAQTKVPQNSGSNYDRIKYRQTQEQTQQQQNYEANKSGMQMVVSEDMHQAEKMKRAQLNYGFLDIPGFVFTCDPAVDAVNYERAKIEYKRRGSEVQETLNGNPQTGN